MTALTGPQDQQLLQRSWHACPSVVRLARDTVALHARKLGVSESLTERLVTVTSELMTNAVQVSDPHEPVRLKVQAGTEALVVSVWDHSPKKPFFQQVDLTLAEVDAHPVAGFEFGGWGLGHVVSTLADEIGTTGEKLEGLQGKWVYAVFLTGT